MLIALVVMAVGLLGLGLLQTFNLRYTQSANQRTIAVNMASELLDTIRTNRSMAASYSMNESNFSGVTVTKGTGCGTMANLSAAENITRWRCEVREKLGSDAYAIVQVSATSVVNVQVFWSDPGNAGDEFSKVELETVL
ncbi:hypothetical protein AO715_14505 [Xanthomonas sp. Mitacek01]|nr:hypothetical protein AO715_14505 [Xanthomonas sp. Mitacek01]